MSGGGDKHSFADYARNEQVLFEVEFLNGYIEIFEIRFRFEFQNFGGVINDVEHTLDGAARFVAQKTHETDDVVCGGVFCGHRAVNSALLQHIVVAELVDFGDDFRHVLRGGKHAHYDVLLVDIAKRDESVGCGNVFFFQKFLICAVAQNDVRFSEILRKHPSFLFVFLDEFGVDAEFVKLFAKIIRSRRASNDDDVFGLLVPAKLLEKQRYVFCRCGEEKSILRANDEIAAGDNCFSVAFCRTNKDFCLEFRAQIFEFESDEVAWFRQP